MVKVIIRYALLGAAFSTLPTFLFAQETDTTTASLIIAGKIDVTNNGFSFVPAFSLGEPAAIVDLSVRWKRFSFEPQFRSSLKGKPWSYIFIYRYKIITDKKFQFTIGAQLPSMVFTDKTTTSGGITSTSLAANRFIVGELITSYSINTKVNIGMFYLYSHGVQEDTFQDGHFLSLRAAFSKIKLSKQFQMNFAPQLFYLRLDENDGYYFSGNLSIEKTNFPISIGSMMYKAFRTDVAGKDFDWNISLIYSFNKTFTQQ